MDTNLLWLRSPSEIETNLTHARQINSENDKKIANQLSAPLSELT